MNIIVWPSIAEEQRSALRGSALLTVQGTWQSDKGVHSLVAAKLVDDSALLGRLRVSNRDFRWLVQRLAHFIQKLDKNVCLA